jgi:ribose-phosphate pyrophosphokinase
MESEINIFAGTAGKPLAEKMCRYLNIPLGKTEVIHFSDGNTYVKIGEHVRNKEVYLVQPVGLDANNDLVELLFWLDAFRRSGTGFVTVVIPYFSYAKGDKRDEPHVSIRARVCAECIEMEGADRIITMDLHAPQILGFFKNPVDHLFARPVLVNYLKTMLPDNAVIVSPDSGNAKIARKYADDLGLPVAIGDKARHGNDEKAEILEIVGNVEGKNAIIVDDFSLSGGTVVNLAEELKRRGAKDIVACFSHIPLSKKGVALIENSCIRTVISTDSVYNPNTAGMKKLKIVSVAPLFAEAVKRMQLRESISDLFDNAAAWMSEVNRKD